MLKKLKEEKERKNELVVRTLKKAKVIQQQQREIKHKQQAMALDRDSFYDGMDAPTIPAGAHQTAQGDDLFAEELVGVGD